MFEKLTNDSSILAIAIASTVYLLFFVHIFFVVRKKRKKKDRETLGI